MRMIVLVLMLVITVGCNEQEKKIEDNFSATNDSILFNENFAFLIGKWKEVEYRGSNGADSFIRKIEKKQTLIFLKDGSVIIEKGDVKDKGKYEVYSDKDYKKLHISSSIGNSYYLIIKENDKKIALNPVTSKYEIICDEGCAYIYKKIK